jgi:catechol 2,3-dioxygenase-like lactoylglutathione lyase family enzyme
MTSLRAADPVVIIATSDRKKALAFYRDTLGLKLLSEDPFAAVFELKGATLRLSDIGDWKPHAHTVFGFGVDNITATMRALEAKGVAFLRYDGFDQDSDGVWTSPDKAVRVAWFNDPDGNNLSLTQFL